MKTDETKGKYDTWGGKRVAGPGKKIGRPTEEIGTNPQSYNNILDDETLAILAKIHQSRSAAIRIAVKQFKIQNPI